MYVCVRVHICIHTYINTYMCVLYICVYMCIRPSIRRGQSRFLAALRVELLGSFISVLTALLNAV